MEAKVLSSLLYSRESYDRLQGYLSPDDFSDKGAEIFKQVQKFYETDPEAANVDIDILKSRMEREFPKHFDAFAQAIDSMEPGSSANIEEEYIALRKDRASTDLAHALLGRDEAEKQACLEEYNKWCEAEELESETTLHRSVSLAELAEQTKRENLIKVFPKALNDKLGGGVPPQTHILVYAPPEVGKSLMAITMACGFLASGKKVLYYGNEDPKSQMLFRFYTCLTGMDKLTLLSDMDKAQEIANNHGYENLCFVSSEGGTLSELEGLVKQEQPDVIIVDQIGNFQVKDKEGTQALEHIAKGVRRILKKYDIVGVSVHQGDANALNKVYLDLGDVYYSNIGVQAAMDVMIGLGADQQMLDTNQRMLNLTKNKISGDHSPLECRIDPKTSRLM